jgi:hypothetical protein
VVAAVVVNTAAVAVVATAINPFWISGRGSVKTGLRLFILWIVSAVRGLAGRARIGGIAERAI